MGFLNLVAWQCPTFAQKRLHYHRRCIVSLSCSRWEGVGPTRYVRQANCLRYKSTLNSKFNKIRRSKIFSIDCVLLQFQPQFLSFKIIGSSLTSNQYQLASCITALPHLTYQRPGLERLFSALKVQGKSHLRASFTLRCFQRLSLPDLATRLCYWRNNRSTRDLSIPVLSYQEQPPSNFQRPRQIGTKLSHDVLNPAHVPL